MACICLKYRNNLVAWFNSLIFTLTISNNLISCHWETRARKQGIQEIMKTSIFHCTTCKNMLALYSRSAFSFLYTFSESLLLLKIRKCLPTLIKEKTLSPIQYIGWRLWKTLYSNFLFVFVWDSFSRVEGLQVRCHYFTTIT